MHSDDSVAVEVPVKPSPSPSTSQKPRQTHSIAHLKLLLRNYVLFSVDVETEGDGCGIIQLSAGAVNLQTNKKPLQSLTSTSIHCSMLNGVKQL